MHWLNYHNGTSHEVSSEVPELACRSPSVHEFAFDPFRVMFRRPRMAMPPRE